MTEDEYHYFSTEKGSYAKKKKEKKKEILDVGFFFVFFLNSVITFLTQSAERLTVVVMKARNLKPIDPEKPSSDPYVKVR